MKMKRVILSFVLLTAIAVLKESELNRLGAEGWELVSIGSPASGAVNSGEFYGVLKRKL